MTRRPSPFQTTLDDLLARHPEAQRVAFTRTGRPVAVIPGGLSAPTPAPVAALRLERVA